MVSYQPMRKIVAVLCTVAGVSLMGAVHGGVCLATPDRLDFGPYELANPEREARVKLGPDETPEVRKAVADMLAEVEAKTGVKVRYSTWSSPVGGDVFISTQPWAAKGAWFVTCARLMLTRRLSWIVWQLNCTARPHCRLFVLLGMSLPQAFVSIRFPLASSIVVRNIGDLPIRSI